MSDPLHLSRFDQKKKQNATLGKFFDLEKIKFWIKIKRSEKMEKLKVKKSLRVNKAKRVWCYAH